MHILNQGKSKYSEGPLCPQIHTISFTNFLFYHTGNKQNLIIVALGQCLKIIRKTYLTPYLNINLVLVRPLDICVFWPLTKKCPNGLLLEMSCGLMIVTIRQRFIFHKGWRLKTNNLRRCAEAGTLRTLSRSWDKEYYLEVLKRLLELVRRKTLVKKWSLDHIHLSNYLAISGKIRNCSNLSVIPEF